MRTVTLYNDTNGHDKIYKLTIEQEVPENDTSFRVIAKWGRRDGAYGTYGLSPHSQKTIKKSGVSLLTAIRYVDSKVNEKQMRGYRVVERVDGRTRFVALPADPPRYQSLSDDCGGNPVRVVAIDAADYWKR